MLFGQPSTIKKCLALGPLCGIDNRKQGMLKLTRFSGHLIKSVPLMEEVFNEQVRAREFKAATPRL